MDDGLPGNHVEMCLPFWHGIACGSGVSVGSMESLLGDTVEPWIKDTEFFHSLFPVLNGSDV